MVARIEAVLVQVDGTLGVLLDELVRLRGAVLDMKVELANIARELHSRETHSPSSTSIGVGDGTT